MSLASFNLKELKILWETFSEPELRIVRRNVGSNLCNLMKYRHDLNVRKQCLELISDHKEGLEFLRNLIHFRENCKRG